MDTRISTNSSMDGYRDFSKEPVHEESGVAAYNASSVHFPTLLHILLSQAEKLGYGHICSWQPHGRAFKIYNREKFVEKMAPLFSKQTRFGSFQRQLNFYGFARISRRGNDHGAYYHELFLRGRPDLCLRLVRCKPLDERDRMKRFPPDFYSMEPVVSNEALQGMASAVATELSMGPSQTVSSGQKAEALRSTIHSKWEPEHITSIQEETGVSFLAHNHDVTEGASTSTSWLTDTTSRINPFPAIPLPDAMLMEHYGNQPQQKQKSADWNAMAHRGSQLASTNLSVDSSSESSNYRRCLSFDSGGRTQSNRRSVDFVSSHCGRHPGTKSFSELDRPPHDHRASTTTTTTNLLSTRRASDSVGWNTKKHLRGWNNEQQQFAKLSDEGLVDTTRGMIGRGATEMGATSMLLTQDGNPISNKRVQAEKDSALLEDMTGRDIDEMVHFLRDVDLEFGEDEDEDEEEVAGGR